jgi:hypothetical protein
MAGSGSSCWLVCVGVGALGLGSALGLGALGWMWCGALGYWGGGSRCGSTGREVLVLVFLCVCKIIEKSFLDRVAY